MKKKVLLTGASGKLGSILRKYLSKDYNLIPIGYKKKPKNGYKLDLTNPIKVKKFLDKINPNIVVHLVSMTNVDLCEKEIFNTYDLNCNTTKYLVDWASKKRNFRFIYISTDQVYDKKGFNNENNPYPKNFYSITKFFSENLALSLPNSVIIRTNFYGYFPNHKESLINWFIQRIKSKKKVMLIKNIFFNPLYVNQLCEYILEILKNKNIKGVLNLGSKNKISKGNFLFKIGKELKIEKKKFIFKNVENINLKAYRPKNMLMCVKKIEKIFKKPAPSIDDGITNLIINLKNNNAF